MNEVTYFCGIDVSKDSFSVAIKNKKFIFKDKAFDMNKQGFEKFKKVVKPFKGQLLIGMESTGIYHTNLFNSLRKNDYITVLANPYKVSQFSKFAENKPTSTDRKSAKTICNYLEFEHKNSNGSMGKQTDERYTLRYLVRKRERVTAEVAETKTEIKRIVTLVFPEIERNSPLFSKEILSILLKFPSANRIRSLSEKEFVKRAKQLSENGKGRNIKINPDLIYQLAADSIAYSYPIYEELLKCQINKFFSLLKEKTEIIDLTGKIADKFFKREIKVLTSIPGIGKESAIYFMAEVVDINRFSSHKKLIGFFGLDPVIKQSGKYKGEFKISKRGNSHGRRIAWIMANCVKRSCPYFRDYYLKKRNEGKSYKEAVIATSTKLLRTIYVLLKENRLFQ